ncbi:MAG: replication-associated recombination protein A [Acidimicrobiia bacterium]|nr:MAG: replication-associated recombination protein A [Acidimicrobiia bacterium]
MTEDDLFAVRRDEIKRAQAPLPARMRPRTLDEVIGQSHLLDSGAAFRSMVDSGNVASMILWGPPGTGKTTLARLIASNIGGSFEQLSATAAGVKDVREILARADQRLGEGRGRTILFLDEIHRFNKAQQDALLPGVEDGTVILIGATTENPFFEVNSPLISRATVFRTEPLTPEEIDQVLRAALEDQMRGLDGIAASDDALEALASRVGGDARLALNSLDTAATISVGKDHQTIELGDVEEALQRRIIRYDRAGDRHYDVVSAFIKSMRGSDPDATLYWLHTMLEAGEDPRLIARRMVVFASEDVGLADPSALTIAVAAFQALEFVGLPEATYNLTHAALALALAPKSNSVTAAIASAREAVLEGPHGEVPAHLRSGSTAGDRALGFGVGYQYPHDDPRSVSEQQYLPDGLEGTILYQPKRVGDETTLADRLARIDEILGKQRTPHHRQRPD